MGEEDWLGPLQVGEARQVAGGVGLGALEEHALQHDRLASDGGELALAPQSEVGGDLVVAAPRRVQLGPRCAGELGDPAFDRRVDVLIGGAELEGVAGQLLLDDVEGGEHGIALGRVDQPDGSEPADVRP